VPYTAKDAKGDFILNGVEESRSRRPPGATGFSPLAANSLTSPSYGDGSRLVGSPVLRGG
jgi:hypothetical protein